MHYIRLPKWHSGEESACQCRRCKRHKFSPLLGKIPGKRTWQPTPGFLPGKIQGQNSLASYIQSMGSQRVRHKWTCMHTPSCCTAVVDSFQFSDFHCPPKDKDGFLGVNTPGNLESRGPWESLVLCFLCSTYTSVSTFFSLLASRNQKKANILLWNHATVLKFKLSVQFSSVAQSCPTLCDPMGCSTPGLPVHHQLPEIAQTHVHRVGDAIQPSHPLSSPSPPTFNLSQHQGLFQWVTSHQVVKVLEFQF